MAHLQDLGLAVLNKVLRLRSTPNVVLSQVTLGRSRLVFRTAIEFPDRGTTRGVRGGLGESLSESCQCFSLPHPAKLA